eukprot:jgi/Tetstr1/464057/TSEL_008862.t1
MHTVSISFCSGTAHHITEDPVKEEILRDISDRMRVRTMMREAKVYRPGSGQDTRGTYVTHLQSRGNPYLLFLTRLGFAETSLYVDRKVRPGHTLPRVIVDHVMFSPDLYDGTVLSGEMVRTDDGEWRFLAEDLLAVRGRPLGRACYRDRYAALVRVVESCRADDASTHRIVVKRVFPADDDGFDAMQRHAREVPYGCTGCVYRSLVPGRSNWFVKAEGGRPPPRPDAGGDSLDPGKAKTKTMTVRGTAVPDVYDVTDADTGAKAGILGVQGMGVSRELAESVRESAGAPVRWRCRWSDDFSKWVARPGGRV